RVKEWPPPDAETAGWSASALPHHLAHRASARAAGREGLPPDRFRGDVGRLLPPSHLPPHPPPPPGGGGGKAPRWLVLEGPGPASPPRHNTPSQSFQFRSVQT